MLQICSTELSLSRQTPLTSTPAQPTKTSRPKLAKRALEPFPVCISNPSHKPYFLIEAGRPEHGGNCDIKNLSRGSKVYLPIHVKGAKFSVGDLHFSQGDGEISFCGAIEMAGIITINFKVMKNGMADLGMKSPLYLPGPVEPHYGPGRYLTFEGFSVDEHGKQVS